MSLCPHAQVFSYTGATPENDYIVKAAVRSALRHKTIQPFCLWSGNFSSPIYHWLVEEGVTVISSEPDWVDELWHKASVHAEENAKISPIFRSREALAANFHLIDLPVIPELDQYVYILVTEPEVFFHRKVGQP
jgi:hypothetical protein